MTAGVERPSKRKADDAGDVIRRHALRHDIDPFELRRAEEVIAAFRGTWTPPASSGLPQPLTTVVMGVRSMARTLLGTGVRVSQRLKRHRRIIEKLQRGEHATMRLSQMDDIGGCRLIVPGRLERDSIAERLLEEWAGDIVAVHRYYNEPKPDGYRALHVVVRKHDHRVEVQLRTDLEQAWAAQVEHLEMMQGASLRSGRAPAPLGALLRDVSEMLSRVDAGEDLTVAEANELQESLARFYRGE